MNISGRGVTTSMLAGSLLISSVFLQAREEVLERLPALGKENKEKTASNSQNGLYLDRSFNGLRWDSGTSEIRISSVLPAGMQSASGSDGRSAGDQFFLRQAQPVLDIRFEQIYGFHIKPVLGTTSGILDAYLESNFMDSFRIRVGRFMPSFGRESLPPVTALAFNERAFPTNNMPIREIGGQIHGEVLGRKAEYQVGVFSGPAVDSSGSGSSVAGYDNSIDFSGRLFARPFQDSGLNLARGLGLGVAFDYQTPHSQTGPGNWGLPAFRSPGQKSFVSNSYDAYAGLGDERIFPRVYYHNGPFGMLAEYILSQRVISGGAPITRKVGSDAFQVQFAWVVQDGNKFFGREMPRNPLDGQSTPTAGALQLLARYSELSIDNGAFTNGLLKINQSARNAKDFGVGVNWYLNRSTKLQLNYDQTSFEGGAPAGADRPDEKVLSSRMQLAF